MVTITCGSPRLLCVHHVARIVGLSCRMVRHLAANGQLPARKKGLKIWTFERNDVEAYVRRREGRYAG